jgi:hypothetical protein
VTIFREAKIFCNFLKKFDFLGQIFKKINHANVRKLLNSSAAEGGHVGDNLSIKENLLNYIFPTDEIKIVSRLNRIASFYIFLLLRTSLYFLIRIEKYKYYLNCR